MKKLLFIVVLSTLCSALYAQAQVTFKPKTSCSLNKTGRYMPPAATNVQFAILYSAALNENTSVIDNLAIAYSFTDKQWVDIFDISPTQEVRETVFEWMLNQTFRVNEVRTLNSDPKKPCIVKYRYPNNDLRSYPLAAVGFSELVTQLLEKKSKHGADVRKMLKNKTNRFVGGSNPGFVLNALCEPDADTLALWREQASEKHLPSNTSANSAAQKNIAKTEKTGNFYTSTQRYHALSKTDPQVFEKELRNAVFKSIKKDFEETVFNAAKEAYYPEELLIELLAASSNQAMADVVYKGAIELMVAAHALEVVESRASCQDPVHITTLYKIKTRTSFKAIAENEAKAIFNKKLGPSLLQKVSPEASKVNTNGIDKKLAADVKLENQKKVLDTVKYMANFQKGK